MKTFKLVSLFAVLLVLAVVGAVPTTVYASGPDCTVNASSTQIGAGETVVFSVETSLPGSPMWDFGDGATSLEPAPEHTFGGVGVYVVAATIRTERYGWTWCSTTVTVSPSRAAVTAGTPTSAVSPTPSPAPNATSDGPTVSSKGDNNVVIVIQGDEADVNFEQPQPAACEQQPTQPEPTQYNLLQRFWLKVETFFRGLLKIK